MDVDEKIFKNILSHLGEAVFVSDNRGNIIYVNDCFLQHSIFSQETVMSFNCNELFKNKQTDINIFQMVMKERQQITAVQYITNSASKTRVNYLVTQTPIMNENGEVQCIVGVMRDIENFSHSVESARKSGLQTYVHEFKNSPDYVVGRPVYKSESMDNLLYMADAMANSDAVILVLGESGVGKEVVSNYIHSRSPRSGKRMVAVNCAALNETLLEAELFGYVKGAFTGAMSSGKKGLIEAADGGTLFLDEIDSLPLSIQAKFLRVLERHEIRPVGGTENKKVDFRVVAATNANLEQLVTEHRFREDLYYRLNVLPLTIPPLRERKEDIPVLASYFLDSFGKKYGRKKILSDQVLEKLMKYDWPGNVRELRNFMERVVLITDISIEEIKDIPDIFFRHQNQETIKQVQTKNNCKLEMTKSDFTGEDTTLKEQMKKMEGKIIEDAVARYGSLTKAAKALGMSKSTLIRKRNECRK